MPGNVRFNHRYFVGEKLKNKFKELPPREGAFLTKGIYHSTLLKNTEYVIRIF